MVDISPAQTSTRTNFRYYIQAMQEVKISSDIPRSTARRMAEDQLRKLVKVGTPFKYEYVSCSSVVTLKGHSTDFTHQGQLTGHKENCSTCGISCMLSVAQEELCQVTVMSSGLSQRWITTNFRKPMLQTGDKEFGRHGH